MKQPHYITPQGFAKLRDELHHLLRTERVQIVKTVAWAASNGDRSENADYIYGKRRLREIDKRIHFLQGRLDVLEIIDPQTQHSDTVKFGATVTIRDENDQSLTYQIVGVDEIDTANKKISYMSPLAQALLHKQVGDVVVFRRPAGEQNIEITKIIYK